MRGTFAQPKLKTMTTLTQNHSRQYLYPLRLVQQWLDNLEIREERVARLIVKLIPAQCPFAREVCLFGRVILRIPPLCKINPLYEQLMILRFRALCFLVEQCEQVHLD
jgi:hypothetical protein